MYIHIMISFNRYDMIYLVGLELGAVLSGGTKGGFIKGGVMACFPQNALGKLLTMFCRLP